ncbi:uncharacterized protein LOC105898226 isoform X2 [Clupea harengus]|uniref:Uncharacterized protein LOC105898226 isoform X2 n=1 Tax=Clupea harengus TaxID=7950 RepID=A0A6P8FY91_CLUHA|nr:uncharacterized protein LOC105898226 isoform X2 [Clupea harengus]
MTSSFVSGVGTAVTSVWRVHTQLDESDEPETSPVAPNRFRKLRTSSSLNSLRMSLRKRLPLKSVQSNVATETENPTWESLEMNKKTGTVRQFTRNAKNSITGAYQKFQKRQVSREDCLVSTPGRIPEGEENGFLTPSRTPRRAPTARNATLTPSHTPRSTTCRTPRSATKRTPRSATRRTPRRGGGCTPEASDAVRGVRAGGGRRQLVRMAALRSPFASPNTMTQRRQFEREVDGMSSGLRKLKSLSQAFNDVIGRDERSKVKYSLMTE